MRIRIGSFGRLPMTALAMVVALAMDLLVLPGLLIRGDKERFPLRASTAR